MRTTEEDASKYAAGAADCYIITTAGGSGSRMGAGIPKQFIKLGGVTILERTIERFIEALPGAKLITVLPTEHIDTWKDICYKSRFDCKQILVAGGITRFHSVKNALAKIPDGAMVAVHDGVRPLVSAELIRKLLEEARQYGSAVPVTPCVDTMRLLDPKTLEDCGGQADRSRLFGIQTPQFFRSEILKSAYRQAFSTSFTDDSSVVRASGTAVHYCPGERFNIKLTTPDDLKIASALLKLND